MNRVVLDAGVGLALLLPLPYSDAVRRQFEEWIETDVELVAPALWSYEIVSSVRKHVAAGVLADADAVVAIDALGGLGVGIMGPTPTLLRRSLAWADRLRDVVAYDAAYVALAEDLAAPLWTADARLARRAREIGVVWVHLVTGTDSRQDAD